LFEQYAERRYGPDTGAVKREPRTPVKAASASRGATPGRAYALIAAELISEIAGRRYRVGDRLPTEEQLADRFAVSRSTVRAALAELEQRGMVDRRPKVGTVIKAKAPESRFQVSVGSLAELLQFLGSTIVKPCRDEEIVATRSVADDLGCAIGERWRKVQALRTRSGDTVPISWTDYYLRPRFASIVGRIGRKPGPVYPLLEQQFGVAIDRIEQDIGACLLPADVARELQAKARSAALRVIHRMISAHDGVLYCTISLYPADRFRYFQALKRS
jgi:GntR family transcriptional regulator